MSGENSASIPVSYTHLDVYKRQGLLLTCAIALALLAVASLMAGARPLSLATVGQALTAFDPLDNEHLLLRHLRLPRTLLALAAGGALGIAGALMQTLTRNPLADPGLLGVNAGDVYKRQGSRHSASRPSACPTY